jgi:hypothetical protein
VPSIPTSADIELAERATAAGWPTSSDQVRELRERRIIPPSRIARLGRGRGTKTTYPSGALAVLLAIRQATADEPAKQHRHRAIVLAWVRGAKVPDEALRPALLRMLAEANRMAMSVAVPAGERAHRRTQDTQRQAALEALATIQLGRGAPTRDGLAAVADTFAPFFGALLDRLGEDCGAGPPSSTEYEALALVASRLGHVINHSRDALAPKVAGDRLMRMLDPEPVGHEVRAVESQAAADLSGAAIRAAIGGKPRDELDAARDKARRVLRLPRVRANGTAPTAQDRTAVALTLGAIAGVPSPRFSQRGDALARSAQVEHHGRVTRGLPK